MPARIQCLWATWLNTVPFLHPRNTAKDFRKNGHVNRISDKTFVETSSFFLCIPFKTANPKSQPVIYYIKIIHKMFALFEGISNTLQVSSCPPLFSFMKPMIHTSALRRAGQCLFWGSPPLLPMWENSPAVNQVHWAKLGESICLAIQHASPCACPDKIGWTSHFFPFCQKCVHKIVYFHKRASVGGDFQAPGLASSQLERKHKVSWSCVPNFSNCILVL